MSSPDLVAKNGDTDVVSESDLRVPRSVAVTPDSAAEAEAAIADVVADRDVLGDGIHVLTAVLLVVGVVGSLRMPLPEASLNLILYTAFAAIYFAGSVYLDEKEESVQLFWLFGLLAVWMAIMFVTPMGAYLAFTIFFLFLRVLDGVRGIVSVMFATSITVIMQIPSGLTLGGIMGPTVSAIVTVAIYFAFTTLSHISRQRAQLIHELMETREQLAESEREAGINAERQRIAHEIHDTLAQGLSSIQMLLHAADRGLDRIDAAHEGDEAVDSSQPRHHIELARTVAADNLQEARAMIAALQPATLAETSLQQALERVAQNWADTSEIVIDVEVDGTARQLPMKTEAALLRIAQGATGNVVKHAGASRARITLTYDENIVRLDVVDNGAGFDLADVDKRPSGLGHVGLAAMRQRAAEQGGQMEIETEPGRGTAVSVTMPCTE